MDLVIVILGILIYSPILIIPIIGIIQLVRIRKGKKASTSIMDAILKIALGVIIISAVGSIISGDFPQVQIIN